LIKTERAREIELYSSVEALTAVKETLEVMKQPLPVENQKMIQRLETLKKSIEELERENTLKNKQLQLIKELKSFNLDEVKLIKNTSSNVQDSIVTFLKRWDSIQRNDLEI
jgi:seryl-tRNA synthetase